VKPTSCCCARSRSCTALGAALLFAGVAAAQVSGRPGSMPAVPAPPGPPIVAGSTGAALAALVAAFDRDGGGFSGVVLVARDGRILLEQGLGLHDAVAKQRIDASSLWDWASIGKQFTAAAVLRLVDRGQLALDDALPRHFPDVPADKRTITVRQLLQHTSGIPGGYRREWTFDPARRESLEQLVLRLPLASEPGTRFEYSNLGYAFAAALVERVAGRPFDGFCVDELFAPAGMTSTFPIGSPDLELARVPRVFRGAGFPDRPGSDRFAYGNTLRWGYRGCGGIAGTARDLLAWDRALRGDAVLSDAARRELFAPNGDGYALGWRRERLPCGDVAWHAGSVRGVLSAFYRLLDRDVCVALACNYLPKQNPEQLARDLLARAAK
jgi:CubicO group peptidase (beta-lactamase class C family)